MRLKRNKNFQPKEEVGAFVEEGVIKRGGGFEERVGTHLYYGVVTKVFTTND